MGRKISTEQNDIVDVDDIPPDWGCLMRDCVDCKGIEDCAIFARAADAFL